MRNIGHDIAPIIPVACGVLIDARGQVLIAQRPHGKLAAGKWEFPGGKIEAGESAHQTLLRELREELDITVQQARPLIRVTHAYTDRSVILNTWLITAWSGDLRACEAQALAWCRPERLHDYDLLAADGPIINALRLPTDYVFTPPDISADALLRGIGRLPKNALLRLRLPRLEERAYEALARSVIEKSQELNIRVMLDREPGQVQALGAAGWHGSQARCSGLTARPLPPHLWFAASAHDAAQLQHLRTLGADFAVLGPVRATLTHPSTTPLGWEHFGEVSRQANFPVYALGGVGPADHGEAHRRYAQGTAGISAYWSALSSPSDSDAIA